MTKTFAFLAIAATAGLGALAEAQTAITRTVTRARTFRVEDAHSSVTFSIGFLGFPVRGRFDDVEGTISYVPGNIPASSVSVAIPVKTLTTGSAHRDEHLRSADFFDAERYPYIVFSSDSIRRTRTGYVAFGPLTMHGVTRTVSIPFREAGQPVEEPHGSTLILFSAALRLARKDFGILGGSRFNDWFDDVRSATMADSVDIALDVQGWDPDYTRNKGFDRQLARVEREGMDSVLKWLRGMRAASLDTLKNAEWEFSQIAKALLVRGKTSDALALMRFTVEVFPKSTGAHCALAEALNSRGDRAEALAIVRRTRELDPFATCVMELAKRL